jgi:hypothetical protein
MNHENNHEKPQQNHEQSRIITQFYFPTQPHIELVIGKPRNTLKTHQKHTCFTAETQLKNTADAQQNTHKHRKTLGKSLPGGRKMKGGRMRHAVLSDLPLLRRSLPVRRQKSRLPLPNPPKAYRLSKATGICFFTPPVRVVARPLGYSRRNLAFHSPRAQARILLGRKLRVWVGNHAEVRPHVWKIGTTGNEAFLRSSGDCSQFVRARAGDAADEVR